MIMTERFHYRGHAVGAAASITRMQNQNLQKTLPVHAACSLPLAGGHSEQEIAGSTVPDLNPFLSFDNAKTVADGKQDPASKEYVTEVTSTVTNVSLTGRFTADRIHAQLVSRHPGRGRQPKISWAGSAFEGLKLDGHNLNVVLDPDLADLDSEEQVANAFKNDPFYTKYRDRFYRASGPIPPKGQVPRVGGKYIAYSIVDRIETDHPNARVDGFTISLDNFGWLYFGEVLVTPESRRLTMVRFELGSPDAGTGVLGEVVSNGETLP